MFLFYWLWEPENALIYEQKSSNKVEREGENGMKTERDGGGQKIKICEGRVANHDVECAWVSRT